MDYSFYGGRPGQSMVIVKYFPSIAKMNEAFDGGDSYTEVGYGECVLINTKNPRNLENGKLYKRGLQGAEYLGTIKGPAGYPPHMILDDYEAIVAELEKYKDENGNINIPPEIDCLTKEGTFDFETKGKENDLVPGYVPSELNKDGTIKTEAQYQDTIKWIYVSVRDFNEEKTAEETTVKIGFKIPYHVYEQTAYSISAYTEPFRESDYNKWDFVKNKNGEIEPNPIKYNNLAWRADDESHPFYSKWRFAVPQGVKGDSIKGLKVLTVKDYKDQRNDDEENNKNIINHFEWEEEKSFTDADGDRQILVYEYYDYRNKFEGDRITKYLGDYNMISGISVDEYGTLKVDYTYKDSKYFYYLVKWVNEVDLNPDNGHFTLTYNIPAGDTEDEQKENQGTENAKYEVDLAWVKDVGLKDGILTFTFTQKESEPNVKESFELDWIQDISIAQNGEVTLTHSYRESEAPNNFKQTILENKLQWVENIQINSDGDVITTYNSTDDSGQKQSVVKDQVLTWIESVEINKENYQFTIIDNHGQAKEIGSVKVDETLSVAFNIEPSDSFTPEGEDPIQAGNLISQNILFLNKKYPKGLSFNADEESDEKAWMKGKIITIGPVDEENLEQRKNFYAFDYNENTWYYLGNLGGLGALKYQQIAEKEKEENINAAMEKLDIGGVCYIIAQRPNNTATTLDLEE